MHKWTTKIQAVLALLLLCWVVPTGATCPAGTNPLLEIEQHRVQLFRVTHCDDGSSEYVGVRMVKTVGAVKYQMVDAELKAVRAILGELVSASNLGDDPCILLCERRNRVFTVRIFADGTLLELRDAKNSRYTATYFKLTTLNGTRALRCPMVTRLSESVSDDACISEDYSAKEYDEEFAGMRPNHTVKPDVRKGGARGLP